MVTSLRQDLDAALKPVLPTKWKLYGYADEIDPPLHPVVMIRQSKVERSPAAPSGIWQHTIAVFVMVPQTDPERAEDALDNALDTLIECIEDLSFPGLTWTGAERVTAGNLPAYEISLTITTARKEQ